jgi:hypothetical protein
VVRRIFSDRAQAVTVREICRRLNADEIPSPTGKATWSHSTVSRLLRNEAYIGRVYFNRTETVPGPHPARRTRQVPRAREDWIPIDCPRTVTDEQFQAAAREETGPLRIQRARLRVPPQNRATPVTVRRPRLLRRAASRC